MLYRMSTCFELNKWGIVGGFTHGAIYITYVYRFEALLKYRLYSPGFLDLGFISTWNILGLEVGDELRRAREGMRVDRVGHPNYSNATYES